MPTESQCRLIMGEAYGAPSPVTCHSPTIYAALMHGAGRVIPIEAEADERALYLIDGDAELDGMALAAADTWSCSAPDTGRACARAAAQG